MSKVKGGEAEIFGKMKHKTGRLAVGDDEGKIWKDYFEDLNNNNNNNNKLQSVHLNMNLKVLEGINYFKGLPEVGLK